MSAGLVVALAVITYVSRASALALLPRPPARLEQMLARIPAPLFAGLAAISLVDGEGAAAPLPVFAAAAGALLLARTRSLLLVLTGGGVGYVLGVLLT